MLLLLEWKTIIRFYSTDLSKNEKSGKRTEFHHTRRPHWKASNDSRFFFFRGKNLGGFTYMFLGNFRLENIVNVYHSMSKIKVFRKQCIIFIAKYIVRVFKYWKIIERSLLLHSLNVCILTYSYMQRQTIISINILKWLLSFTFTLKKCFVFRYDYVTCWILTSNKNGNKSCFSIKVQGIQSIILYMHVVWI